MFESFKKKTVEDIVETAKDSVKEVVNTGIDEKVKGVVMLLPLLAAGFLVFSGGSKHDNRNDLPDRVVINNYYYGKDDIHDSNNR